MAPAEVSLWKCPSPEQSGGRKFGGQQGIDNWIVGFYRECEGLMVELDGEVHMDPTAWGHGTERTGYPEDLGPAIPWFENKMAFENLPSIPMEIKGNLGKMEKWGKGSFPCQGKELGGRTIQKKLVFGHCGARSGPCIFGKQYKDS